MLEARWVARRPLGPPASVLRFLRPPDAGETPDAVEIFEMLSDSTDGTLLAAMLHSLSNDRGTEKVLIGSTGVGLAIFPILNAMGMCVSLEGTQ